MYHLSKGQKAIPRVAANRTPERNFKRPMVQLCAFPKNVTKCTNE